LENLFLTLILDVTSSGKGNRAGAFLPLKPLGSLEAHVLPAEACVLPKPLGPSEACVLAVEACVPPKPLGPLGDHGLPAKACVPPKLIGPAGNPSSSMAGTSQGDNSGTPSPHIWPVTLDSLSMASLLTHACCIAKLSNPAITTINTHHSALPSPDIFHLESSKLAGILLYDLPSLTRPECDSEDEFEEESCTFDALVSACYKKVANQIWPVWMTLPEEYHTVQRIPSDPLLSLPTLPTHPPNFIPSEKFTQEHREKMNINMSSFLWLEEEKLDYLRLLTGLCVA